MPNPQAVVRFSFAEQDFIQDFGRHPRMKEPLVISRHERVDNIKMHLGEIG
jgi:hypothetical protein